MYDIFSRKKSYVTHYLLERQFSSFSVIARKNLFVLSGGSGDWDFKEEKDENKTFAYHIQPYRIENRREALTGES